MSPVPARESAGNRKRADPSHFDSKVAPEGHYTLLPFYLFFYLFYCGKDTFYKMQGAVC